MLPSRPNFLFNLLWKTQKKKKKCSEILKNLKVFNLWDFYK